MANRIHAKTGVCGIAFAALFGLTACGSEPSLVGMWEADDGTGIKTIAEDGRCSGMYYNQGKPLDIGGGMLCTLGEKTDDGTYLLLVQQPPNERTYQVQFKGDDTAVLMSKSGEPIVTLIRQ